MRYLLLILSLVPLGCTTEYFGINKFDRESDLILGEVLSPDVYLVDPFSTNGFRVFPEGSVAVKDFGRTNHMADITFRLESGEGIRLHTRAAGRSVSREPGITIDLKNDGIDLYENGKMIHSFASSAIRPKEDKRIRLVNKGKKLYFYMDCAHIFTLTTALPCTEYIILGSLKGSSFLAKGINITDVFGREFTDKATKSADFKEL